MKLAKITGTVVTKSRMHYLFSSLIRQVKRQTSYQHSLTFISLLLQCHLQVLMWWMQCTSAQVRTGTCRLLQVVKKSFSPGPSSICDRIEQTIHINENFFENSFDLLKHESFLIQRGRPNLSLKNPLINRVFSNNFSSAFFIFSATLVTYSL